MPTISTFYRILIQMFWNDHARYGMYCGIIDINSLQMLEGDLPKRALGLVRDWAKLHQNELLTDWDLCTKKQMPNKIEPLK